MQELIEIEALRRLKSRYFRLLDCKKWEELRQCFTDDFTGLVEGPHPDIVFHTPEEYIEMNREVLAGVPTVHHGHMPEIDVISDAEAKGIWAMYDRVELPGNAFEGWGHYHEEYRKQGGDWKISRMHITRLIIRPLVLSDLSETK